MKTKNSYSRKKFFKTLGLSAVGFSIVNSLPFKFFSSKKSASKINVRINPLAISRNKSGDKNV